MERRKHQRFDISINLRVETPDASYPGVAQNISSRSIFLNMSRGSWDEGILDVDLHIEIDTGMQVLSRKIAGRVVRNEGIELVVRFSEYDILARAVVHEVMYYMQLSQQLGVDQKNSNAHEKACAISDNCAA